MIWRRTIRWTASLMGGILGKPRATSATADDSNRVTLTHPDTLRAMQELATTLRAHGDVAGAEAIEDQLQRLYEERVRRLHARQRGRER